MTNEEILKEYRIAGQLGDSLTPFSALHLMDLARADERQKMKAENVNHPCPNCDEYEKECACMRNICKDCGKPVGNITFSVCDKCWDKAHPKKESHPTSGMTEAEFQLAKQGAKVEDLQGNPVTITKRVGLKISRI